MSIVQPPKAADICSLYRTQRKLDTSSIEDLAAGRILAIRIPNFYDPACAKIMSAKLLEKGTDQYANAAGVLKVNGIGIAFFETRNNPGLESVYYEKAEGAMKDSRELFAPYPYPIDILMQATSEAWEMGAELLDLGKGPMFSGLPRVVNGEILPHEDKLERDLGYVPEGYITQFAANVYLQVPEKGGELVLWSHSLDDDEYDILRGESYGISPELLPPSSLKIKPEPGELVLFMPRNLHAVAKTEGDYRIGISTFILYSGKKQPLKFWS